MPRCRAGGCSPCILSKGEMGKEGVRGREWMKEEGGLAWEGRLHEQLQLEGHEQLLLLCCVVLRSLVVGC